MDKAILINTMLKELGKEISPGIWEVKFKAKVITQRVAVGFEAQSILVKRIGKGRELHTKADWHGGIQIAQVWIIRCAGNFGTT